MPTRPVVLYDSDCRFCRWAARSLLRLDRHRRLAFLALEDEAAAPFLSELPQEERLASWRLITADGRLVGRGAAGGQVLELVLPRLGRAARALPLERGYELVARNRSRLGRLVADGPAPRRFP